MKESDRSLQLSIKDSTPTDTDFIAMALLYPLGRRNGTPLGVDGVISPVQGFHLVRSPISDLKFHFHCGGRVPRNCKLRDGGEILDRQDGQALRSKGADQVHGVGPSSHGVAGMPCLGAEHTGHVTLHGHTPKQWHHHHFCFTDPVPSFMMGVGVRTDVNVSSSRAHSPSYAHHAGTNCVRCNGQFGQSCQASWQGIP